jgi:hypothetical protein
LLASGIGPAATSLTVSATEGALFPAAGAGSTFDLVIYNTSALREIVSVTARAVDVFTIVRAQQGTTALTWNAGDRVSHRLTADALNNILFTDDFQENVPVWCGTAGGTANALTLTPTPAITGYAAGHHFIFKSGAAANTTAVTVAVSGLATKAIQDNGNALIGGEIEANKWFEVLYDGTNFQIWKYQLNQNAEFVNPNYLQQTLTDGATIDWNMNLGGIGQVTLGGNRTVAAPTGLKKAVYILYVIQDGTGSRTLVWNAVFKWTGAIAPALTAAPGSRDVFSFVSDGTNLYGSLLPDVR